MQERAQNRRVLCGHYFFGKLANVWLTVANQYGSMLKEREKSRVHHVNGLQVLFVIFFIK